MIEIIPATEEHVQAMRGHIRQADQDELWDGYEITPDEAMHLGLKMDSPCWAALRDGQVLAVGGIVPALPGGRSIPWMVGSDRLMGCKREFLEWSRGFVARTRRTYGPLENWVDARNRTAIRWLRAVGFKIHAPQAYGKHNLPFCHFEMR